MPGAILLKTNQLNFHHCHHHQYPHIATGVCDIVMLLCNVMRRGAGRCDYVRCVGCEVWQSEKLVQRESEHNFNSNTGVRW